MESWIAIRKSTRAGRRGGEDAVGLRAARREEAAEGATHRAYSSALSAVGLAPADEVASRAPLGRDLTADASYEVLPHADAVVVTGEPAEIHKAQEILADEFYLVPDISLTVPTPVAMSERLDPEAARDAVGLWPEEAALDGTRTAGARGAGTIVVVLDTGCDADHAEFTDRSIEFAYAPLDDKVALREVRGFDTMTHGTHVAGIIAGANAGLAPEAELLVGSVIESETARTSLRRMLRALDWALQYISRPENQDKPTVLNLSLGFRPSSLADGAVNAAMLGVRQLLVQLVEDYDVLPVVAIGNDGAGATRAPGYFPEVLSVGAVDASRNPASWSGGGRGPVPFDLETTPDVVGYGVDIVSGIERDRDGRSWYARMDGTSMAAPYVSGIAALVAGASGLQGAQLHQHLISRALPLPGHPPERVGAGLVRFAL